MSALVSSPSRGTTPLPVPRGPPCSTSDNMSVPLGLRQTTAQLPVERLAQAAMKLIGGPGGELVIQHRGEHLLALSAVGHPGDCFPHRLKQVAEEDPFELMGRLPQLRLVSRPLRLGALGRWG